MCLLLLHHRTRPDHPLILLANRDEAYDRPFDPPAPWPGAPEIVAPRDRRGGGTWLGVNRRGLVAAVTNRPGEDARDGTRSRGLLVLDALRHGDAAAAAGWAVAHLAGAAYAGFHLLLADGREAWVVRHRGASVPTAPPPADVWSLAPGAHVLTNLHEPDQLAVPPAGRPRPGEPLEETLRRLRTLAADETPSLPGGHRILKRGDGRGTVASALIVPPRFLFAAGAPDRTPFRPVPWPGAEGPAAPGADGVSRA